MRFLAIGLAIGLLAGWWLTDGHYTGVMASASEKARRAEALRYSEHKVESDKLYDLYSEVTDAPPVFADRVVFVKTAGPVRTITSGCVAPEGDAPRVELASGIVRSVESVAIKHKKLYEQCAIQLRANQSALKSMASGSYK